MTLTFDLTHDLDLGVSKVRFQNSCISRIVCLIVDVMQKGSNSIRYWADYMSLTLDHTHVLNLEVSRSKFDIALSNEWEGQLTWYETDESIPFMTMTLTFM